MKKRIAAVIVALLLSVVAASTCSAQQTAMVVNIPFAFQAGNHTLPAGEYVVETIFKGGVQLQRLRQVGGSTVMIVSTISVETRDENSRPELVFNRYGQLHFLSQIWAGGTQGHELSKSNREKEIAIGQRRTEVTLLLDSTSVGQ
jgi:hypothetical protein